LLSRVADSLYWMSRYLERAEHTTRLLDVNLNLMLDETSTSSGHRWTRLLQVLGKPRRIKFNGDPYELTRCLTFDTGNKSSVVSCILSARENARHVREQISTEQWQRVNSMYLQVTRPEFKAVMAGDNAVNETPSAFLQQVMEGLHQFQGVSDGTMSHGEGWQFIQVGRFLERATAMAMLLEAYHDDVWANWDTAAEANQYLEWMGLLRSATAFEAYCKVYTADLSPERILEFLLLDEQFPHSLRFSIDSLQTALESIQDDSGNKRVEQLQRLSGRLQASLQFARVDEILNGDVTLYLHRIQHECQQIHETIYELYVDYSIQAALAG
jgi:uncharacterized alpha-E superfamily protein